MGLILVSGLVNIETTVRVRQFPINYYPIDYPFFGVHSGVSGVGYNIAKALNALHDDVQLLSMVGHDFQADYICSQLCSDGISTDGISAALQETASSVVLYDGDGKRQIYCDLKDVQQSHYDFPGNICQSADIVVACNINFNRPLLHMAKSMGKTIATDVHVLSDIYDEYNREFLECADIVFLSDEAIGDHYRPFLWALAENYSMKIIVLGRGGKGAAMYLRDQNEIREYPAVRVGEVVNTVGAGDALFSAFVHYYIQGKGPEEALKRAQVFASKKISESGASRGFATQEEMEALWEQFKN